MLFISRNNRRPRPDLRGSGYPGWETAVCEGDDGKMIYGLYKSLKTAETERARFATPPNAWNPAIPAIDASGSLGERSGGKNRPHGFL